MHYITTAIAVLLLCTPASAQSLSNTHRDLSSIRSHLLLQNDSRIDSNYTVQPVEMAFQVVMASATTAASMLALGAALGYVEGRDGKSDSRENTAYIGLPVLYILTSTTTVYLLAKRKNPDLSYFGTLLSSIAGLGGTYAGIQLFNDGKGGGYEYFFIPILAEVLYANVLDVYVFSNTNTTQQIGSMYRNTNLLNSQKLTLFAININL